MPPIPISIPIALSAIGTLGKLFAPNKKINVSIPNLSELGLSKSDIDSFFNLRRALTRANIQRQGANAARVATANLPSALRNSTVPASIAAGIQTQIAGATAEAESAIDAQRLQALMSSYNAALQRAQLLLGKEQAEFQMGESRRNFFGDIGELGGLMLFDRLGIFRKG
jgi:hypothetical protein